MIDIKERVLKAIELHKQGVNASSLLFQKLLFKVTDSLDRKFIREAFYQGKYPFEKSDEIKTDSSEQNSDSNLAVELEKAIKSRAGIVRTEIAAAPEPKKKHADLKEILHKTEVKNQKNEVSQGAVRRIPEAWRFEGLEPKTFDGYMYAYCATGLWGSDCDKKKQLRLYIERNFPEAETALAEADAWLKLAWDCLHKYRKDKNNPELKAQINAFGDPLLHYIKKIDQNANKQKLKKAAHAAHKVEIKIESIKQTPGKLGNFPAIRSSKQNILDYNRHQNDITGLMPESEWTLLIDESGHSEKGDFSTESRGEGVIAGVLYPNKTPLPKPLFPELHASDDFEEKKIAAADKLIENLLNGKQFGVLALPIKSLRSSKEWGSAIGLFVDLVLRLLPLHGKTKLNVLVENKDAYDISGDFAFLRDACYYRLMQSLPERSELITLDMGIMTKKHPLNSYPDIVANACLAWSNVAQERLRISGWRKSCYLEFPPEELARVLEYYYTGKNIRPSDWNELLAYDGMSGQNFLSGILANCGREIRSSVSDWELYLKYVIDHLNSKSINLRLLERQVSYLMDYQPEEKEIPARLNLLWLTSCLAAKNHQGKLISDEEESEFRRLIRITYPEDSQLACWTTLHLAVAMTDSFDFNRAKKIIRDYYDVRKYIEAGPQNLYSNEESRFLTTPLVISGTNYFAQMLSSYGQHEAFAGNTQSAVLYFRKALELFGKLNDKQEGAKQIPQTHAYLVLAMMDLPSMRKEFQTEFVRFFGKTAPFAVKDYAGNTGNPYSHHILIRAMADHLLPATAEKAYLSESSDWKRETWHPWELIEFYRGVLCKSLKEKKKHMRTAYEMAVNGGGATLRMIGCGILGALYFHDQSVKNELEELTNRVIAELPRLGTNRIAAMKKQIESPDEPMTYIKKVLPFNFR